MGWGIGDEKRRENAQIQLSNTKRELYRLGQMISAISHDEKRQAMQSAYSESWSALENIEETLTR